MQGKMLQLTFVITLSNLRQESISHIRRTNHMPLNQVSNVSVSKTGKHGHAKCNFTAIDIFTGKKYEDIIPSTHTAHVPTVVRKEYSLVDITPETYLSLMDDDGNCREDVKLPDFPDNFGREIQHAFDAGKPLTLSVLSAMGHDQVIAMKEDAPL